MDTSDANSSFELVSSQEEKPTYDKVPYDKLYKFKILSLSSNVPTAKKSYKLKAGTRLPYCTNMCGKILISCCFPKAGKGNQHGGNRNKL